MKKAKKCLTNYTMKTWIKGENCTHLTSLWNRLPENLVDFNSTILFEKDLIILGVTRHAITLWSIHEMNILKKNKKNGTIWGELNSMEWSWLDKLFKNSKCRQLILEHLSTIKRSDKE